MAEDFRAYETDRARQDLYESLLFRAHVDVWGGDRGVTMYDNAQPYPVQRLTVVPGIVRMAAPLDPTNPLSGASEYQDALAKGEAYPLGSQLGQTFFEYAPMIRDVSKEAADRELEAFGPSGRAGPVFRPAYNGLTAAQVARYEFTGCVKGKGGDAVAAFTNPNAADDASDYTLVTGGDVPYINYGLNDHSFGSLISYRPPPAYRRYKLGGGGQVTHSIEAGANANTEMFRPIPQLIDPASTDDLSAYWPTPNELANDETNKRYEMLMGIARPTVTDLNREDGNRDGSPWKNIPALSPRGERIGTKRDGSKVLLTIGEESAPTYALFFEERVGVPSSLSPKDSGWMFPRCMELSIEQQLHASGRDMEAGSTATWIAMSCPHKLALEKLSVYEQVFAKLAMETSWKTLGQSAFPLWVKHVLSKQPVETFLKTTLLDTIQTTHQIIWPEASLVPLTADEFDAVERSAGADSKEEKHDKGLDRVFSKMHDVGTASNARHLFANEILTGIKQAEVIRKTWQSLVFQFIGSHVHARVIIPAVSGGHGLMTLL